MNALVSLSKFSVADPDGIFAPVSPDLLGALLTQYQLARADIAAVSAIATGEQFKRVMHYFASGNVKDGSGQAALSNAVSMFAEAGAIAALNASYWSKALKLTDVYDMMPQKRRDEWNAQINQHATPEFTAEIVIPTIVDLLNMRPQFLAERVDGIFQALSGEHVTNCPQGFGKRMIMYVTDSYGSTSHTNLGHLTDLRKVIAKFMGRDEPRYWGSSEPMVKAGRARSGEWTEADGGTLRIRVYQKGTAHLEVHPEMVWRLNAILAYLHPLAIPAEFRTKPKRKQKEVKLTYDLLPFAVIERLQDMKQAHKKISEWPERYSPIKNGLRFDYGKVDKHVQQKAESVLKALGGVWSKEDYCWLFDYDALSTIQAVCAAGHIPEQKSHQYYPTPEDVAKDAVELAEIGLDHDCLEPSAGQGGLADLMPKEQTCCVEVSPLHCRILKAKGHNVIEADFLKWAELNHADSFDRIVMNPPYSCGRWQSHTEKAFSLLRMGGVMVAILPATARNSFCIDGAEITFSRDYKNEFSGTGITVVIARITKR